MSEQIASRPGPSSQLQGGKAKEREPARRFGRQSARCLRPWRHAIVADGVAMGGQPRAGYTLRDSQRAPGSARNVHRLHPASALPGRVWLAPAGLRPRAGVLPTEPCWLGVGKAWPECQGGANGHISVSMATQGGVAGVMLPTVAWACIPVGTDPGGRMPCWDGVSWHQPSCTVVRRWMWQREMGDFHSSPDAWAL